MTLSSFLLQRRQSLVFFVAVAMAGCAEKATLRPLSDDAVILAFGDSLTYGTGASETHDYPSILADISSTTVINAGVPGEISRNGLKRLPGLLEDYQPDLVILIHGGNDLLRKIDAAEIRANLTAMIDLIEANGASVIMLGVPRPGIFLKSADFYESIARQDKLPIDTRMLARILGDKDLKSDTVHPNNAGYRLMAEAIYRLLQEYQAL